MRSEAEEIKKRVRQREEMFLRRLFGMGVDSGIARDVSAARMERVNLWYNINHEAILQIE